VQVDVAIDGADEVNVRLDCIKGGGGCQTQEKLVAANAKRFVVIADSRKQSSALGRAWTSGVPVEVLPAARVTVALRVAELGGRAVLREGGKAKAGPAVTDQGNIILDCDFGVIDNPQELDDRLRAIVGVVETGLFVSMADHAYFGQPDGSVIEWSADNPLANAHLMP
jgi:ribose 5-phosphate isomerase A